MRISNISQIFGSGNTVFATELINGSARHWNLTLTDNETGNPIDLTNYTFEFDTVDATATIKSKDARKSNFTVNDLTIQEGASPTDRSSLISVVSATDGQIGVYLPVDFYSGTVPFDAEENVPVVVGTIRFSDGQAQPTIHSIRLLIVVRYGVVV